MRGTGDTSCEDLPAYLRLPAALGVFATKDEVEGQGHIKPLHQYIALRLVFEGGFLPDEITPCPPLTYTRRARKHLLDFCPPADRPSEKTVIGGLKTKAIDVVVCKPDLGPVVAVSVKGATRAFRNLTNRMEEAIGDCTNLHIMHPGLVYGFFCVIRANREGDPGIHPVQDVSVKADGSLAEMIARYCTILANLAGRKFVRNEYTRYEAVGVLLVERIAPAPGAVFEPAIPLDASVDFGRFFPALYNVYDLRYPYMAGDKIPHARRVEWAEESPAFEVIRQKIDPDLEAALGYPPRLA